MVRELGAARLLVAVYAVFSISATARAAFQISTKFDQAPLAYSLSALAAVVYLLLTFTLAKPKLRVVSQVALIFELLGVLSVGALSQFLPELFAHPSVWSNFGAGYGYIPLFLPIVGLLWLVRKKGLPTNDSAVAIGKFDALHLGHQAILSKLREIAAENNFIPTVLTFDRHPNAVLDPSDVPPAVVGKSQKLRLLQELGISRIETVAFTKEFSNLTPGEFVERHLVPLRARKVVVAKGFRFGAGGRAGTDELARLGMSNSFEVIEFDPIGDDQSKYSTSRVRNLLATGGVEEANAMLGRLHATEGIVEHGRKLGRTLGYPTANLARDSEGLLPADGVYAGYLISDGIRYPAAHSVGTNDSIEAVPRLLESHVIGRDDLDLYGKNVVCEYVAKVRGWAKFDSVEQLKAQIADDVAKAKQLLLSRVEL